jgi:uncharacterized membrane protein YfcA
VTLLLITIGCAMLIGVSVGTLGAGGSILSVPLLVHVTGRPPREAIATSLVAVGVTSVIALVTHARAGRVRWQVGAIFGAAGMIGAYGGGRASALLPERALMTVFGVVMAAAAIAMLRGRRGRAVEPDEPRRNLALLGVQGAAVGSVTGLVGAGGGFIIVPSLNLLARLPIHAAVGTSLMVIAMNATTALVPHLGHASIDPTLTAAITVAMIAGSLVGGQLAGKIEPARLRTAFGGFVIAVALFVLFEQI